MVSLAEGLRGGLVSIDPEVMTVDDVKLNKERLFGIPDKS